MVGELTAVKSLGKAKAGSGSYIYDMGENVMGVPQLTIPADYVNEGDLVIVRFAEVLYPDLNEYQEAGIVGLMMVENLRAAMDTDFYVATAGDQVLEHDAYKLFEQEKYASWLYPVKNGATSVWERWNSYTVEDGFGGNNSMNSFDHFSLGAIAEWMMRYHLGIDHEEPGWQKFVLAPVVGGSYTSAKGSFHNPWGTVESGME